jgi:hypothetical protein
LINFDKEVQLRTIGSSEHIDMAVIPDCPIYFTAIRWGRTTSNRPDYGRHATMRRTLSLLLAGTTICAFGLFSAGAQEAKKAEKPKIPGGIEGHVKSVDVEKGTLTIVTTAGAERTYNVTDETTMLGPRGGKVRRHLHDPRFHEGMDLTVVASGATAKEIHLGFRHREPAGEAAKHKAAIKTKSAATKRFAPKAAADEEEADDEDNEIPGTVKSYNAERRLLVVSLLNGTSRPFFLSRDLKVQVKGAISKHGVADPAIKEGAHVIVHVEEGGRRVRELHVDPAPPARTKKKAA